MQTISTLMPALAVQHPDARHWCRLRRRRRKLPPAEIAVTRKTRTPFGNPSLDPLGDALNRSGCTLHPSTTSPGPRPGPRRCSASCANTSKE